MVLFGSVVVLVWLIIVTVLTDQNKSDIKSVEGGIEELADQVKLIRREVFFEDDGGEYEDNEIDETEEDDEYNDKDDGDEFSIYRDLAIREIVEDGWFHFGNRRYVVAPAGEQN
jgi:hypothetical protein